MFEFIANFSFVSDKHSVGPTSQPGRFGSRQSTVKEVCWAV